MIGTAICTPEEQLAILRLAEQCAERDFIEDVVSRSETDHRLDYAAFRAPLRSTELLGDQPVELEVTWPIKEFALSALWIYGISYWRPGRPHPRLASFTLFAEKPLSYDLPENLAKETAAQSLQKDLTEILK